MTSRGNLSGDRGDREPVGSSSEITSAPSLSASEETMKRAAVKQRIEGFYYQLTDGCGKSDCHNECCASSQQFKYRTLSRDQAAAQALVLFREKADLCEDFSEQFKMPKNGSQQEQAQQGSSSHSNSAALSMPSSSLSSSSAGPSSSSSSSSRADQMALTLAAALQQVDHVDSNNMKLSTDSGSLGMMEPVAGCSTAMDVLSAVSAQIQVRDQKAETSSAGNQECQPAFLSESTLAAIVQECESVKCWSKLIRTLGSVFSNPDAVLRSFLRTTKEDLRSMEVDMDKDTDEGVEGHDSDEESGQAGVEVMDSCDSDIGGEDTAASKEATLSSPQHGHVRLKGEEVTVDIESVRSAFSKLFAIPDSPFQSALTHALRVLSRSVEMGLRYHQAYERDPNYLNIFIIIFEILLLDNRGDLENAIPIILKAAGLLPTAAQVKLARVWAKFSPSKLKEILGFLHQVITLRILSSTWSSNFTFNDDDGITGAAKVMKILFYACVLGGQMDPLEQLERERLANEEIEASLQEFLDGAVSRDKEKSQPKQDPLAKELGVEPLDCRKPVIAWEDFVNDSVSEGIRMEKDYTYYKGESDSKFSFLTHSFLLTTAVKNLGMYYDSKIRMVNERRVSLLQSLVNGAPTMPYLRIRIRRDHIIDDALVNLEMIAMDNPQDLKKQLYVEFEDEQGIDEGGVSKEFFQLVVEEIFNPDIGMFVYDDATCDFWFNSTSFENDSQFTLIGIVLGLAIYNNIILDVHFPMVVYRKLMGKLGTFEDLKDSHPTLAKGLKAMLKCESSVEETFMQTFCISYTDVFGQTITTNLKEGGGDISVTDENKQEYVDLYADFLLNKSIEKQFRAFKRGFRMVTDESPLKMLFQPSEVELLVCGSKHWDFQALEDATDYDGGFTPETPVIKYFWEVVHDFSEDQKRKLLQFTTGSDRVPVGGLAKLKLVIARHGPDSDRLPTAHTCFNVLLLPDYSSKDKLEERLTKAILYAKGFGML